MPFVDRTQAGRALAAHLQRWASARPIILALPRGGVPIAVEVARALHAPIDVLVVRKIGAPFQPELGIGAVAEGNVLYVAWAACRALGVSPADIDQIAEAEEREIERRIDCYRDGRPLPPLADRTVILVDDGLATGATARAAARAVRAHGARQIVFATPVAAPESVRALAEEVDTVVALEQPAHLHAVGAWYRSFRQLDDDEVRMLLRGAASGAGPSSAPGDLASGDLAGGDLEGGDIRTELVISVEDVELDAELLLPADARGLVIFAHGNGSADNRPRDRFVAEALLMQGIASVLVDLLTRREQALDAATSRFRFDVPRLATRLTAVTDWLETQPDLAGLPLGYFGASTGAAAALLAAAARPHRLAAVVCRGGRVDLADAALHLCRAPTLFIVGGEDDTVLELNERALAELSCEKELAIVPAAGHLFEEPGTIDEVAAVATGWLTRHLLPMANDAAQP
jgi:putative phosphoribosyl transferase